MTHTVMKFVSSTVRRTRLAPMGDCRRGPRWRRGAKRMTTASVPPITPSSVAGAATSPLPSMASIST